MTQNAAQAFVDIRTQRPAWPGVPDALRPKTIEEGYRLQQAVHDRLAAQGDPRVGWKIGSTSAAGQQAFGITEPVYAGLLTRGRALSLAEALARPMARPALECEIAVILSRDIDGADPTLSTQQLMDSVAACHIACEIIDNRFGDPKAVGVPTLLADDYLQVGFVLGAENRRWREQDLTEAEGAIEIDGQTATGSARTVLSAFDALRWLAVKLASVGRRLHQGEVVLTGTLVPPTPISLPARSVTLSITGFEPLRM
jgi:2-keto-4-pentenoate hydratase